MAVLLMGRWSHGGNLRVTDSVGVEDGDEETMEALVSEQDDRDGMAWACSFLVDRHEDAIQQAYEEYVRDERTQIVDEVMGYEPATF